MNPEFERSCFLREQAQKINRLASKPVIRATLQDYISREFPRPLDQMLTYKIPMTLTTGETKTAIWGTHHDGRDLGHTKLPPLATQEEEEQRFAVMLVAIHDVFSQLKISDGLWSTEVLECLVSQVKKGPPDGPSEDAILEALNWLEPLAEQQPAPAASVLRDEGVMDRHDIATELAKDLPFFKKKWKVFCRWVERCAWQLDRYERRWLGRYADVVESLARRTRGIHYLRSLPTLASRETEWRKLKGKLARRQQFLTARGWVEWQAYWPAAGCFTTHLRLPLNGLYWDTFYVPSRVVNPVVWVLGRSNPRGYGSQKEQLLVDCALLSVAYDSVAQPAERICSPGNYRGTYFDCDGFCETLLAGRLDELEKSGALERAWNRVSMFLETTNSEQRQAETASAGGVADAAKPRGNITGMSWQQARDKTRSRIDKPGFTFQGIEGLAKSLGCSENTLRKALKNTPELNDTLNRLKPSKQPKAVYLNEVHRDNLASPEMDPTTEAEVTELTETLSRSEMIQEICCYHDQMRQAGNDVECPTEEELALKLTDHTDRDVAELLSVVRADADECHTDDSKTPGRRPKA